MPQCLKCQKQTVNPKFCSRSCCASFINVTNPRKKKKIHLCECGRTKNKRSIVCKKCTKRIPKDITLQEALNITNHKPSLYNTVRARARIIGKHLGFSCCAICGYSQHYQVCHIKPIHSFDLDTKLSVINNPTNLVPLCPNHHWELDNNKINLIGLRGIEPLLSSS